MGPGKLPLLIWIPVDGEVNEIRPDATIVRRYSLPRGTISAMLLPARFAFMRNSSSRRFVLSPSR